MKDKQRFDLGVKYFNEEKYERCFVTLYPLLTSEWQSYESKEVTFKDAYYYVAVSILNGKLANTYKDTYNELVLQEYGKYEGKDAMVDSNEDFVTFKKDSLLKETDNDYVLDRANDFFSQCFNSENLDIVHRSIYLNVMPRLNEVFPLNDEYERKPIHFSDVSFLLQAADYGIADAQYMLAKCFTEFEIPTCITQENFMITSEHKANPEFYDELYAISYLEKALDNNNWIDRRKYENALFYRNWILDGKPED